MKTRIEAGRYSAVEALRGGERLEIRALRPDDAQALLAATERTSSESLARRFFTPKRGFTEKEIAFYTQLDFVSHVALVALVDQTIVGGGRYIVGRPGHAEIAFAVEDAFQGRGIASALLRHLTKIARAAGIREFQAEVLPDNGSMLKVFERSGLAMTKKRERDAVHLVLLL